MAVFSDIDIDDRTENSSHGYRAIHTIISTEGRQVEIQVRTLVQHLWAELSEKLSDVIDPAIKYGGGPKETRESLLEYSDLLGRTERLEREDARRAREVEFRESQLHDLASSGADLSELNAAVEEMKRLQREGEETTQKLKRSLAILLTDYYNGLLDQQS
jgi:ppGpp synthetase/RelA/SpoT-type nucleotidyltranferase